MIKKKIIAHHSLAHHFRALDRYLDHHRYDDALSELQTIIAQNPKNFYALTIERRLKRLLETKCLCTSTSNSTDTLELKLIEALQHLCQLAIKPSTMSPKTPIHHFDRQLREQALEDKHQALLHHARQQFHVQHYERALREAKRALIIRPDSAEAQALIQKITLYIANQTKNLMPELDTLAKNTEEKKQNAVQKSLPSGFESVSQKILSSVTFAEYYRTNAEYSIALKYIDEGLDLDPANEVLLQLKEDVEKFIVSNPIEQ
jgi:tetratricopeptide (TPR) repeat protein